MIFADLVTGDSLFVDANTLVYHCTLDPKYGSACTDLLDRIGHGEITAFTSTHILLEVCTASWPWKLPGSWASRKEPW